MSYYKRNRKLETYEYDNGVILPKKDVENGPRWGVGGVCIDNQFCEISFYDGGWAQHGGYYEWDDEDYIDEVVVYAGIFFQHWGHFLIDNTNRLWYLNELSKSGVKIKVGYVGDEELKGNNLEFFRLLGVEENQLLHIKKPTRFRKVIVPEQGFKSCEWYTDEFQNMFDDICDNVMNSDYDFCKVKLLKNVYFTRRNFAKALSSEFGEKYFEDLFVNNGYFPVAPETLSLQEQIYIWNVAEEIVCINGTIPLNVIFSKNTKLKLTVLNKTSLIHENPYILLQMKGISANFVDIYKEPYKKYPRSLGQGPFLLDYSIPFEKYCNANGLKQVYNNRKTKLYFFVMRVKYILYILGIKRRLMYFARSLLRKLKHI